MDNNQQNDNRPNGPGGAGQGPNRNRSAFMVFLAITVAVLLGMALFLAVPDALLSLFDASETMLAIGAPALRIISVTFPVAAVCIVISGAFQGLGYGVYSMITSLARQLIVLVPSAYILARIGLQTGNDSLVWLSYPIAEVASAAVTALLFVRLYRKVIRHVPEGAAH